MWTISNPNKLFASLVRYNTDAQFQLFCIMTTEKYNLFSQNDRNTLSAKSGVVINTGTVHDPNNNAQTINVTIISYTKV